jgi:hypothetical protein
MEREGGEFSPGVSAQLASCFWCESIHRAEHELSVCRTCRARFSTMRLLEMSGSYPLDPGSIDDVLMQTSPGNYALGYMDGGVFEVFYVGRSDSDLRRRLHEWVGMPTQGERYASSAKASWDVQHRGPLPVDVPALGRVGNSESSYTRFAYSYAVDADAAFDKECRNYDDFGGRDQLDNEVRPQVAYREIGSPSGRALGSSCQNAAS